MKTIILHGELGKRFGRHHKFAVKTVGEAIRALKANFKGFESYMVGAHQNGVGFKIFVGPTSIKDYPEINYPSGERNVIRIAPVLMGSKSPVARILIGAALVITAVAITVLSGGTLSPLAANLLIAGGLIGASMIIGGVSQLLSPVPKEPDSPNYSDPERKTSYIFSGPTNVSSQGRAVPVGYGRMIVGSVVVSAGLETYEIA